MEQINFILAFAKLAEIRDRSVGNHVNRVYYITKEICFALREKGLFRETLTDEYIEMISHASLMHDIGKVAVPDRILLKPGLLSLKEFDIMAKHVELDDDMLNSIEKTLNNSDLFKTVKDIILYHHENYDGSGYIKGIKGDEIPLPARIVALADFYDALRSERIYKNPVSEEETLRLIRNESEKKFFPYIIDALESKLEIIKALYA